MDLLKALQILNENERTCITLQLMDGLSIDKIDGINTEITKGLKQGDKIVTEIVVNVPEEEDAPQQSQGLISGPGPRGKKK